MSTSLILTAEINFKIITLISSTWTSNFRATHSQLSQPILETWWSISFRHFEVLLSLLYKWVNWGSRYLQSHQKSQGDTARKRCLHSSRYILSRSHLSTAAPSWTQHSQQFCPTSSPMFLLNGTKTNKTKHYTFHRGRSLPSSTDCEHAASLTAPLLSPSISLPSITSSLLLFEAQ